jgi:membrane protease YdiL (CAAX protease family)
MEKEKKFNLKNMLTGIGVIFFYLFTSTFVTEILSMIGINYNNLSTPLKSTCLIIYQILMTLVIVYIYKKTIITDFKIFIKNNIKYFKKYIKYWFLMLILMISSNLIVTLFTTTDIANNQNTIIETLKVAPIYTFILTVFVAPILEELVFRLSFRKIFSNNILFILLSGLVFGSMHVIGTCEHLIDLLFIIPYSIPGFIFAYVYTKSKNICIPISLHFIHNGIMMSLQILLVILT